MLALALSLDPKSHIHILRLRYEDANCGNAKTSGDLTEEIIPQHAAAGACANNGDNVGQTVVCTVSTDTSDFVMAGETFKMVLCLFFCVFFSQKNKVYFDM